MLYKTPSDYAKYVECIKLTGHINWADFYIDDYLEKYVWIDVMEIDSFNDTVNPKYKI